MKKAFLIANLFYCVLNASIPKNIALAQKAFEYAASRNTTAVVNLVSQKDSLVFARTENGRSLLHIASATCNKDLVVYLLNCQVALNIADVRCMTPLHYAALYGQSDDDLEVIKLLVNAGADLLAIGTNFDNIRGVPLDMASYDPIVRYLTNETESAMKARQKLKNDLFISEELIK